VPSGKSETSVAKANDAEAVSATAVNSENSLCACIDVPSGGQAHRRLRSSEAKPDIADQIDLRGRGSVAANRLAAGVFPTATAIEAGRDLLDAEGNGALTEGVGDGA